MANIVDYARTAQDTFDERPLTSVDALCLAWLAYLRLPAELGVDNRAGIRLADLAQDWLRAPLTVGLRNPERSWELLCALGASPRFGNVRACLHASEASEEGGMQFAATTFVLPGGTGAVVAYRGTDDTTLGWKENLGLACSEAVPAQRRAASYLEQTAAELGCRLWVCGHSKGGALASYASGMACGEARAQVVVCWSFDGPGLAPEIVAHPDWQASVPTSKLVPQSSLVGMLFERSQDALTVVRSSAADVRQHDPFSWEVAGGDFVAARGLDYDAWRLSQRLNDWLCSMSPAARAHFAELLGWLMDATAESTFSGLLARWQGNARAMQAALEQAPAGDRELFGRAMDDLAATLLLGSAREYERPSAGSHAAADVAARKVEDLSAHVNDSLSRIDQYLGR